YVATTAAPAVRNSRLTARPSAPVPPATKTTDCEKEVPYRDIALLPSWTAARYQMSSSPAVPPSCSHRLIARTSFRLNFKRTPTPPPFSPMNTTPASSSAFEHGQLI